MALRTALGNALHRTPEGLRRMLPSGLRDEVRRRVGPFAPWEAGFTHSPSPPAPGEVVGPPDFVGIGVQKAGTTWWFTLIVSHPDIFQPATVHKERHYFAPYATHGFGAEQVRGYHQSFRRPEGLLTGEWTPDYIYQPWVPELLERAAPEARLVVMVRDPVDRLVSGLAHTPIAPGSHLGMVAAEAVHRGLYAAALQRWAGPLQAGRILVLQYEQCVRDPVGQLGRTFRFLGIDDQFHPRHIDRVSSSTRTEKVTLDQDARKRLVALYEPDVDALVGLVPDLDLTLWPNFTGH